MGSELIARGVATSDGLWSAGPLLKNPDAVLDVHLDYLKAGANIITTNTYSTIPSYLAKNGLADRYEELARLAGVIAQRAVEKSNSSAKIAGSIPPLDESYRPDLVWSREEGFPVYMNLATALVPYVDYYLCETMSSVQEASVAVDAVRAAMGPNVKPILVSFTLLETPDGVLRSGESVETAALKMASNGAAAVLFNCSSPEAIEHAIELTRDKVSVPIGGYPNRFSKVPTNWTLDNDVGIERNESLTAEVFTTSALRCFERGASIYGGCCGTRPEFIKTLSQRVDAQQTEKQLRS